MNPQQRHDFAFYEAGESARRFAWLVLPLRRFMRRLLGPVWQRERELFEALSRDISEVEAMAAYLSERLEALESQVHATAALGWDHVALTRRLAALEDRLTQLEEPPTESSAGHEA